MIAPARDTTTVARASPTAGGLIELLRATARQAPIVWALPLTGDERALLRFCAARAVAQLQATALAVQEGVDG